MRVEKNKRCSILEEQNQLLRNIHYSKDDLNEHAQPMKQVNLDEAMVKLYVDQHSCGVNIGGAEKMCCR